MSDQADQPPEPPARTSPTPPQPGDAGLTCTPSFAELFRYMDGVLDQGRDARVRSHLDDCSCCGELYHFQTRFRQMIELRCQVELPPDLPDRIFGSLGDGRDEPLR